MISPVVQVWGIKGGQYFYLKLSNKGYVSNVAYGDGIFAAANYGYSTYVYNDTNGDLLFDISHASYSVAINSDIITTGDKLGNIKSWDSKTGLLVLEFEKWHHGEISSLDYNPINYAILASGSSDNTTRLWDTTSGKCLNTYEGHTDAIYSISFSPDGKMLASASLDNTIKLWDVETGECIRTIYGFYYSVSFSPDGKYLVSGELLSFTIKIWDVESGKCIYNSEKEEDWPLSLKFSSNGYYLVSSNTDGYIKTWDCTRLTTSLY